MDAGLEALRVGAGRAIEVFLQFLRLGVVGFGGPVAHLGLFHRRFVQELGWLGEGRFAQLVALAQLLPGPASSQVAMAIGHGRAGLAGLFAAWLGFTLPAAGLMTLAGALALKLDLAAARPFLDGLEVAALAVVADAWWRMLARQRDDHSRLVLVAAAALLTLTLGGSAGQFAALGLGALVGMVLGLDRAPPGEAAGVRLGAVLPWLVAFFLLLGLLPLWASTGAPLARLADGFYRAGALVFGGGHVVLPLLAQGVVAPGLVPEPLFLAGYGLAQAVPGPLVSLAAYLGMVAEGGGLAGALVALLAIYAPSLLLVAAGLPLLAALRRHRPVLHALAGVEVAVVGLLLAALLDPVLPRAVDGPGQLLLALAAFAGLRWLPVWFLVPACALAARLLAALG